MDNIEIQVYDEINDYKEKIYFFNFRQWVFAILIVAIVIPTYLYLKEKIGEEITSYIIILIAGILGFIGFVRIHELPAEQIIPFWIRHYLFLAKPIHYITDAEFEERLNNKKYRKRKESKRNKDKKINKIKLKEEKKEQKRKKLLEKAMRKYGYLDKNTIKSKKDQKVNESKEIQEGKVDEISERLSHLTKEQQDALLKLLGK